MVWDTDLICWSVGHDDSDDRDFNHIKGVFLLSACEPRKKGSWLVGLGDEILPSYIGIIMNHYKDSY